MLSGPISFPAALDEGFLAWAEDLHREGRRPEMLRCVGCHGRVMLRAGTRQPHFAHWPGTPTCDVDGALRKSFVLLLSRILRKRMKSGRSLPIAHWCRVCQAFRDGDLARHQGGSVEVDVRFSPEAYPDLLVRDAAGRVRYVVEIIGTHAPERAAMEAYLAAKVAVVRVWPRWETVRALATSGLPREAYRKTRDGDGTYDVVGLCFLPGHGKKSE